MITFSNNNFFNYFFGFDSWLEQPINWIFNINHLFFAVLMTLVLLGLYHGLHAKTKRGIIKTKITLVAILFALEVGRMIWVVRGILPNTGETRHPLHIWSFTFCAINSWVTMGTLTASIFVKSNNKALVIFKNILFGSALVGGGLASFVLPEHIAQNRSLLHFQNIQTIGVHILLVFVPLWLIKIEELEIRFKNLWMPALGFIGATALSVQASHITGHQFNFEFSGFGPLESISFPFQLPVMFVIIFLIPTILYGLFEIYYRRKNKEIKETKIKRSSFENKMMIIDILNTTILFLLIIFVPLWLGADANASRPRDRALLSWNISILMIPFVFHIVGLVITHKLRKKESKVM